MLKINLELDLKLFRPPKNNLQKKFKPSLPIIKPQAQFWFFLYFSSEINVIISFLIVSFLFLIFIFAKTIYTGTY